MTTQAVHPSMYAHIVCKKTFSKNKALFAFMIKPFPKCHFMNGRIVDIAIKGLKIISYYGNNQNLPKT